MIEWFRSWHGAPTDNKWLVIARKASTSPGVVSAIIWALLDHASQASERGNVETFDVETYSAFSGFSEETIRSVIAALVDKGVINAAGQMTSWEKRQPKREDNSTDRVRAHRERMKRNETLGNVVELTETVEKIREEKKREKDAREARSPSLKIEFPRDGSISFGRWGDLCRQHALGWDVERIASEFRKFCHGRGIEFDDRAIEKTFVSFCQKQRKLA